MMEPLASFGSSRFQPNTNISRSLSLSIIDRNENEVLIQTNISNPIEIIIPRDSSLIVPRMTLHDVMSTNSTPHKQLFHLHYVNITSTFAISVHLEIHPLNRNLSYLLIYKFDQIPQLNSSVNQIDGWILFCLSSRVFSSAKVLFTDFL